MSYLINIPPSPPAVPPTFTSPILNVTAVLSTSATLPCRTILDSTLTFSWLFDNKLLSPAMTGEGPLVLTANGSLILASVARASEGIYTCVATNSLGVANGTVYLVVYGKVWSTGEAKEQGVISSTTTDDNIYFTFCFYSSPFNNC